MVSKRSPTSIRCWSQSLKDTYGVIVFQEQAIKIASEMGGYTLGKADILRKAMGKKDAELMRAQKEEFVQGCQKNKIDKKTAELVFDLIEKFAGYGFNKSHSVGYALLAYRQPISKHTIRRSSWLQA